MRAIEAIAFGGPEVLQARQFPAPVARAGEVVIEVTVAPVLFLDTQIRAGLGRDWFPARPPYVPGAGVAGTVGSVGTGVEPAWAGRRVVADTPSGGYLEQAVVPAGRLIPVPDGVDPADAAALLHDGRTALALVEATVPRAGEWVLVTGAAGGLGILLVQLARQAGAWVIGAARGEKKLALIEPVKQVPVARRLCRAVHSRRTSPPVRRPGLWGNGSSSCWPSPVAPGWPTSIFRRPLAR